MKSRHQNTIELTGFRLRIIQFLSAVAFGLSAFLLWGSFSGDQIPGCGVESGCKTVMQSRWSQLFGVPVSFPALILYASILLLTIQVTRTNSPGLHHRIWAMLIVIASSLIGAAAWFIGLQVLIIQAICPFCMTAHTIGLVTGALLLVWAPWNNSEQLLASKGLKLVFAGLGAVLLMGFGQMIYAPPTYNVQPIKGGTLIKNEEANQRSTSSLTFLKTTNRTLTAEATANPKKIRKLEFHGGAFSIDLDEAPLLGSPEAPYIIIQLYDYSCRMCRQLHPAMSKVVNDLSNQLAVVCLPVPLATNCNPLIKHVIPDHIDACAYAKIGLAIWRTNRAQMHAYDDWFFKGLTSPSVKAAEIEAMRLLGTNVFTNAIKDPWIKQQLDFNIRIFETNWTYYKKSSVPQLLIGTNIVSGYLRTTNDLYRVITNQFPLRLPFTPIRN